MYAWVGVYWCGAHSKIRSGGNHLCLAISVPWGVRVFPSKSICVSDVQCISLNRWHGAGGGRRVNLRIPRMCVGIHRLFLCKFSLRWGAPPHSLVPALPDLFSGGYGFFRRKASEPTTYSVFRQTEPTARSNVASWAHESREGTWAFSGSSSVSSPSAEGLYRPIQ